MHSGIDLDAGLAVLADRIGFVRSRPPPWSDSGVACADDDPYTLAVVGK